MKLFEDNGAYFSPCRKYRYALWRIWDTSKPLAMFIGLNPSTANENTDDATIRRVKRFAHDWGYGGVYMMNCFAYVSKNPNDLIINNYNAENNNWLMSIAEKCQDIYFAWGNFKVAEERGYQLSNLFPKAKALQINKNGSPKHPLYIKSDIIPILFNPTTK